MPQDRTQRREARRAAQEERLERIREELDEMMLANPNVAHIARESPLSKKYQAGRVRLAK